MLSSRSTGDPRLLPPIVSLDADDPAAELIVSTLDFLGSEPGVDVVKLRFPPEEAEVPSPIISVVGLLAALLLLLPPARPGMLAFCVTNVETTGKPLPFGKLQIQAC